MDDDKKETENGLQTPKKDEAEEPLQKLPYPKSVFFIVSNEFCERFSYYGMRTILSLYLVDILLFNETDAKVIYHVFTMFVYFFPIFGAMLADSLLGKFYTILYVSMIYAVGNIVLAMSAAPPLQFPQIEFSLVGLLLIAIGTGGIKPCVSAFGGDQFKLPQQALQLAKFFSMFYFSINAGSLISTTITPILREDVHCFEDDSCYSLAFAVPGVLMIISIAIFALGKPLYKIIKPEGNMVIRVSKCISYAIKTKVKSKGTKKDHWLDYSEEKYGRRLVDDVKATLKVLVLYIPLPVFWALFDQQGTGWTFQARRMSGDIGFYTILPDQMQVVNPLLILLFIPLFQYGIYPVLNKLRIIRTPLQRLVVGGILAAVSFVISAGISLILESEYPILPSEGNGHLRIYNNLPCVIDIDATDLSSSTITVPSYSFYENIELKVNDRKNYNYAYNIRCLGGESGTGEFVVYEEDASGYYFRDLTSPALRFNDSSAKATNGYPRIRTLINGNGFDMTATEVKYFDSSNKRQIYTYYNNTMSYDLRPDEYIIQIGTNRTGVNLKLGAVYVTLVSATGPNSYEINVVEITAPNSVHMLWLIPQYVVITMGEVMFSITGLEFSYSQAPISMKSVLQACWLLTTAFGNLIVVIVESAEFFEEQSNNFFLYAGLMLVDMFIFSLMAMAYKYVKKEESETEIEELPAKKGIDNASFVKETDN